MKSWNLGILTGAACGITSHFVLRVLGTAAIWGYSEATGLREDHGNFTNNHWALATLSFSALTSLQWLSEQYEQYHDFYLEDAIREQRIEVGSDSKTFCCGCGFFAGFRRGIATPAAAIKSMRESDTSSYQYLP